jgi:hypothetical protein
VNKEYLEEYPEFWIKNNGHTGTRSVFFNPRASEQDLTRCFLKLVQVQLKEEMTSSLKIDGDGFRGSSYQFSQMHFHWGDSDERGSEHTVGGTGYIDLLSSQFEGSMPEQNRTNMY